MTICLHCKRTHIGEVCPMEQRYKEMFGAIASVGDHIDGAAPNVFVGRYGYPKVQIGFLAPPGVHEADIYDAPRMWSSQDFGIPQVAHLRRSLVQSRFVSGVQETNRLVQMAQEIAMAQKPTEVDIVLSGAPKEVTAFDGVSAPFGPSAQLKEAQLISQPSITKAVEKAVGDVHATATQAASELYDRSFDEQAVTKLLSLGTLGRTGARRLVPTRWAITATDDMLGEHIREEVMDFAQAEHQFFWGGYLGNYYLIMLYPYSFSYELFEMNTSTPDSFTTDHEFTQGRTNYAQETAGGYYACRYPILERLKELRQQAAVLVLRFITPEYTAPLGVWVVREATRNALRAQPIYCSSRKELLEKATHKIKEMFGIDIQRYLKKSLLLDLVASQKRLTDY